MLTLDIVISTYKPEGIRRLANSVLPEIEGVSYIVVWQRHDNAQVPEALNREDIKIFRSNSIGLSNNRNEALACAQADLILIADDDINISATGVRELINIYEANPSIDLITFKSIHNSGCVYPLEATHLHKKLPKGYFVSSIEISFRSCCKLTFCPELGLNSERMHAGEDAMLLQSAIHKGFDCWFFPITVTEHDHPSTGIKTGLTNGNLRAMGCVIALTYGWQAPLRGVLKAWRASRFGQAPFFKALFFIAQGIVESRGVLSRNHDSLW